MILFLEDWAKYPTAIIDTATSNASFLRLSALLKKMGVKNHAFMLALYQPELRGVNPHDPNLTLEQKSMISDECQWNPWYVIREVIRLPPSGGPNPIPFKANRGNISLMWSFFNHIDFALIQPRQTGKSASTDVLMVTVLMMMGRSTRVQLITKDHNLRRQNVSRIKGIRDYLPAYLNPMRGDDTDNTEGLTVNAYRNEYVTAVGQKSKEGADNLGRGLTAAVLHGDELPYIPNIHISLPVALSAGNAARENAAAAGGFYGNIFTTTAGKRDTKEGKFAYNLIHDGYYWNECLYDQPNHAALIQYILDNSNSEAPMINGTFSHRQLGRTDEWLFEAISNSRSGEDLANRDYFNMWTSGTESSPLSIALNKAVLASEMDPFYNERTSEGYELRWYVPASRIEAEMDETWHIISLDSSQAVGRDANGLVITNVSDMSVTAASNVREANLYKYAKWIAKLLIKYPKTIFVIENKASGQAIIDTLIELLPAYGIDPFKRIYSQVVEEAEVNPDDYKEILTPLARRREALYLKYKRKMGFNTNGNSRQYLYDQVLRQAANTTAHLVHDTVLSQEIRSLVDRNGRVDHPEGGHDDVCIAWLLAHYFVSHSRNIEHYGIDRRQLLSRVTENGAIMDEEQLAEKAARERLRMEIDDLKEMLKASTIPQERMRIEFQLAHKVKLTELDGGETYSIDAIKEEAREYWRRNKTERMRQRRHGEQSHFYNKAA